MSAQLGLVGRCGGDQFLIAILGGAHDDARSMAARLRDCVSERPFDILQATVTMTASIGIALSVGRSPLVVLREAEHALSRAKLAGGACARWFPSNPPIASNDPKHLVGAAATVPAASREVNTRSVPA